MSATDKRVYLINPQLPPFTHKDVDDKEIKFFIDKLKVTDNDIREIEDAPQRSQKWKDSKEKRIGGSTAGAACGNNKYMTQKQLIGQMMWNELKPKTSAIMQRGITMENYTTDMMDVYFTHTSRTKLHDAIVLPFGEGSSTFMSDKDFKYPYYQDYPNDPWMENRNFIVCKEYPFLGCSPDGIYHNVYNESKAPANNKYYPTTPMSYFCQFQLGMYIMNMKKAVLSVYTERGIQLRFHDFDQPFWDNDLFPALQDFYMNQYVPRMILKEKGLLTNCCVDIDENPPTLLDDFKTTEESIRKKLKLV